MAGKNLSMTGDGAAGWGIDIPLTETPLGSGIYTGSYNFVDGEIKFREDNNWAITYGQGDTPNTLLYPGLNIPVVAGFKYVIVNLIALTYYLTEDPITTDCVYSTQQNQFINGKFNVLLGLEPYQYNITQPANGHIIVNQTDGTFLYTPNLNYVGTDLFTYYIIDDNSIQSNTSNDYITIIVSLV